MFSDTSIRKHMVFKNIHSINIEAISQIQKDLSSYDIKSLVFLIYDGPATALERLTLLQRVAHGNYLNLLCDWAARAQADSSWRYVFLEALFVCQLYNIIRKLGFNVNAVKTHYSSDNSITHINPMKMVLYKLCENTNNDLFLTLKKTLLTYDVDITHYEACELVFLDLIKRNFISLVDAEKLACIVERIPALQNFALELRQIKEKNIKKESLLHKSEVTPTAASHSKPSTSGQAATTETDLFTEGFEDIFNMLEEEETKKKLEEKFSSLHLKSDTSQLVGAYEIKNLKRTGVAYIINQEKFYPSKQSLEKDQKIFRPLDDRNGSKRDKLLLEHVLRSFKFKVFSDDNLDSREMLLKIKNIMKEVTSEDSAFILCILSHGIKGEVFASDSISVKVEDIQNLLDSTDGKILWGMPKVLIIQACQVVDHKPPLTLVADSPSTHDHVNHNLLKADTPKPNYFLRKSDYLIFWATAPEYEAFRDVKKGSIFIQTLCYLMNKRGSKEHLIDIFTEVILTVKLLCTEAKKAQLPIFKSTLAKKLYLTYLSN